MISRSMYYLSYSYTAICKYDIALEFALESLKISKHIQDRYNMAMALHNLATIYSDLRNFNKALEYNMRSLEIKEIIGDKKRK